MSDDADSMVLDLMEILLTASVANDISEITKSDLPQKFRKITGMSGAASDFKRPLVISEGMLEREMGVQKAYELLRANPFVDYDEFGQRLSITALAPAMQWFVKKGGDRWIERNPALALYAEKNGIGKFSYQNALKKVGRFEDSVEFVEAKIAPIVAESEEMRNARDLIIIYAPDEIEFSMDNLVCTEGQKDAIKKIDVALKNRDFLRDHRIYEFGKLLFVGPPGTGKTSVALALSRELHMPLLEVRLAMITSQYLGETSKNIDRIFELARRLSPCILFIDEFDFVAKSRLTDDNAAMKRAVNMLLKNIDMVSFVKNGVLLIGATNHPALLDEAAWRRFDDVVEFPMPSQTMRRDILQAVTSLIECECDFDTVAQETEGFSGADLRMMIKEAIIAALMENRHKVTAEDIEIGMQNLKNRHVIRSSI
ncbi:ATP-binding protein [Methanogenium organophilum]|uniref:ATP-binding protein n=1 Tax=Methanogenium organophilum TaxID=2199 RepID=A0A9X9S2B3_METOG|nr:ATP-binding protein [Methanogenium organophilum]WAI00238.1 ATP-binding protein [Methanogenium organophilum]